MKRERGFKLIELLVVVSIIALLVAILMPALGKARDSARGVVCLSNIKSLTTCMLQYANEFKSQFPVNGNADREQPTKTAYWYDEKRIGRYLDMKTALAPDAPSNAFQTITGGVMACPNHLDAGRSYTMNFWAASADGTNKKPKGSGFDLDPSIRRDTGRWVEVIGRPRTRNGVVVIDALEVTLTQPPTPKADAAPAPPPPERPKDPPVIVFSLPLDGESDFDFSGRIVVQFNNDMDEESFKGRVGLRYAGPARPGDPGFESMRVSYNAGMKALVVDPGAPILRGRVLDLVLLTGIVDLDGQPLTRRDGKPPKGDIAEMLRFR